MKKIVAFAIGIFLGAAGSIFAATSVSLTKEGVIEYLTYIRDSFVIGGSATSSDERLHVNGKSLLIGEVTAPQYTATSTTASSTLPLLETTQTKVGSLSGVIKAVNGVLRGSASTSDLPEGTNFYYTNQRVRNVIDSVKGLLMIGTSTPWITGELAYVNSSGNLNSVATTSVSCSGSVSCSTFTAIGASPVTISGSGGGGASSTLLADGNHFSALQYFDGGFASRASSTVGGGTNETGFTVNGPATTTSLRVGVRFPFDGNLTEGKIISSGSVVTQTGVEVPGLTQYFLDYIYSSRPFSIRGYNGNVQTKVFSFENPQTLNLSANFPSTRVGVGTSSPYAIFSIHANSNGATTTNSNAIFAVASSTQNATTTHFVVSSDGNVGIATTSPYARLSVVGETVSDYFTATSTIASSTLPLLETTQTKVGSLSGIIKAVGGVLRDSASTSDLPEGTNLYHTVQRVRDIISSVKGALTIGTSTPWNTGELVYVKSGGNLNSVATTSVSCSGSVSCSTFTAIGTSPITISGSGAGSSFGYPFPSDATNTRINFINGINYNGWLISTTTTVCASGCQYTSIQAALNDGNKYIVLKPETYNGPVLIDADDVTIKGAGMYNTIISCNGAVNGQCVAIATTTSHTRITLQDFGILNTNPSRVGVGLTVGDASHVRGTNIRINNFLTAHSIQDLMNQTYYHRYEGMIYFDVRNGMVVNGTLANDNISIAPQCRVAAGETNGVCYDFVNVEGWKLVKPGSEPGASFIGTAFRVDGTSIGINVDTPWFEANATGTEIQSGALNISVTGGGRITGNTIGFWNRGSHTILSGPLVSANTVNLDDTTKNTIYLTTDNDYPTAFLGIGTSTQKSADTRLTLSGSFSTPNEPMLIISNDGPFAAANSGIQFTNQSAGANFPNGIANILVTPGSGYTNASMRFTVADANKIVHERLTLDTNGFVGIGSTTPSAKLGVNGNVLADFFRATSTTFASFFPFASTTVVSGDRVCIGTDCRTAWPTGGSGGNSNVATSTFAWTIFKQGNNVVVWDNVRGELATVQTTLNDAFSKYIIQNSTSTPEGKFSVYIAEGLYPVNSTTTITGNSQFLASREWVIRGANGSTTILLNNNTSAFNFIDQARVTLSDMSFAFSSAAPQATAIFASSSPGTVQASMRESSIDRILFFSTTTGHTAYPIIDRSGFRNHFTNLDFFQTGGCIRTENWYTNAQFISGDTTYQRMFCEVNMPGVSAFKFEGVRGLINQNTLIDIDGIANHTNNTMFDFIGVSRTMVEQFNVEEFATTTSVRSTNSSIRGERNSFRTNKYIKPANAANVVIFFTDSNSLDNVFMAREIETDSATYLFMDRNTLVPTRANKFLPTDDGVILLANIGSGSFLFATTTTSIVGAIYDNDTGLYNYLNRVKLAGDRLILDFMNGADTFITWVANKISFFVDGAQEMFLSATGLTVADTVTASNVSATSSLTSASSTLGMFLGTNGTTTTFAVRSLVSCDTIDTDANGVFRCGTDATGGSGGSGFIVNATGTPGQVAFFSGTNSLIGNNNLFWDNIASRLGIGGTTSPSATLSVVGQNSSPSLVVATSSEWGSVGMFLRPIASSIFSANWWQTILGGATSTQRYTGATDNIAMLGRMNSDTLIVNIDPSNVALLASLTTNSANTSFAPGVLYSDFLDGNISITTTATSSFGPSGTTPVTNGCNDGGAWFDIRANESLGAVANEGGVIRGTGVFNVAGTPTGQPAAMNGGHLTASGTPVMEITICTPTVISSLAGSSTTIMPAQYGFGFGDTAVTNAIFLSSNAGPANGAFITASTTDNWWLVSTNNNVGAMVDTGVSTSSTRAAPQTFRLAKTATATYAWLYDYNAGTWNSIGTLTTRQTSSNFSWFVTVNKPGSHGFRADLLFRNLKVWYSPTYRF